MVLNERYFARFEMTLGASILPVLPRRHAHPTKPLRLFGVERMDLQAKDGGGRLAAVTGITGFIGGHLARELSARGWRLRTRAPNV